MFNSNIIDVAIGLVFIFLLLSLICSAAHELIEVVLKQRAANLEKGIKELAGSDSATFVAKLYSHGLINSLYVGKYESEAKGLIKRLINRYFKGKDLPSYIPSQNFALALMDLRKTAPEILPQNVKDALQSFDRVAGQDLAAFQKNIEDWYDSSMDRVSGWYKRSSQRIVLALGLVLTIAVNADCIAIAKRLSTNSNLRQSVEQLAESAIKEPAPPNTNAPAGGGGNQATNPSGQTTGAASATPVANLDQTDAGQQTRDAETQAKNAIGRIQKNLKALDAIGLPLGKDYSLKDPEQLWTATKLHWLGWLITAMAISLGAPFWFDMLNKIIVIRSTVKPSEKSGEEASKDARQRQSTAPSPDVQVVLPEAPPPGPPADGGGGGDPAAPAAGSGN